MSSKSVQVSNRNATARYVVSSIATHTEAIAKGLVALDGALPAAERIGEDGARRALSWLGATLSRADAALERAELVFVAEKADDPAARVARDAAQDALLARMVKARERIAATLGADGVAAYDLTGATPRNAEPLAEHAGVVIGLLRAKPQQLTDELGTEFDTAALADALEAARAPLVDALADVTRERREFEAAMLARDRALAAWVEVYQGVANALTGLYRLAGRDDLAARIRPTSRRISGEEPASDAAPDPSGDASGDAVAEPSGEPSDPAPDGSSDAPSAEPSGEAPTERIVRPGVEPSAAAPTA